ncbi:protein FAM200A-like [Palaemon carinicauda]|uniref:protein FAM200A-like n=1 Tax=Palaemon carinicauda TaxID=392227 RepID=UPI0035B63D38
MHSDVQNRFSDLLMMVIQTWVSIPFEVNVADIDISLQERLIELQSDEIMRAKFKDGKCNVWKTNDVATKYPLLWDRAQIYVIAFPTSYLVESGFSRVSQLLSKARNRLGIVKTGDFRLSLTSMEPDIKKLAEQHQPQGPH